MNADVLRREVRQELGSMARVVDEVEALAADVAGRDPTARETVAAGSFLAQFYMGIENVLKRLTKFHEVEVPSSPRWHVDLFELFCEPAQPPLPLLFERDRIGTFDAFRRATSLITPTDSTSDGSR